jgi:hypothetical protein
VAVAEEIMMGAAVLYRLRGLEVQGVQIVGAQTEMVYAKSLARPDLAATAV